MTAGSTTVKGDTDSGNGMQALVVEGGALRGVFSTGLLDGFLEADFNPFDLYIGVSAGASNLAAYLAGMMGRNGTIYRDHSLRPEFINLNRFLRGGHLLDLDWLWEITIREIRLDLMAIYARRKPFVVVLTDVLTGQAVYRQTAEEDLEHTLKASSAIPLLYRSCPEVDGRPATDGGIADAIPVGEAIRRGARRVMVVRSRPRNYVKRLGLSDRLLVHHMRRYPLLGEALKRRAARYNESVVLIRKPPDGIDIIEICPPADFRVSRLSRNRRILDEGYEQGRMTAADAIRRWEAG